MDEGEKKQPTNGEPVIDPYEEEKREEQRKLAENLERVVALFRDTDLDRPLSSIVIIFMKQKS
jgi:hypothetical protein